MKKIFSLLIAVILFTESFFSSCNVYAESMVNICQNKNVISSSRLQYNELYPHNLTDGDENLRASSYFIDLDNPYEWFRIDLAGEYAITQITVCVSGEIIPSNLAIDVWSNGKWVRVVSDYSIDRNSYPINYYFDEINASYIQISSNGIPSAPEDVPESAYAFSLSEVEAYYVSDIPEDKKIGMIEDAPSGTKEIPIPESIDEFLFKQGLISDSTACPQIPEDAFTSDVGQFDAYNYSAEDIKYLKAIYKNSKYTGNTISLAGVEF